MVSFQQHLYLLIRLARREVLSRYKNSALGLVWAIIQPFAMLLVYSFVFSVVLKARWSVQGGGDAELSGHVGYALTLFCGLLVFNLFAENANRAPGLIFENPNYVKRMVFPLHLIPLSVLAGALLNMLIGLAIVAVWVQCLRPLWPGALLALPFAIFPLLLFSIGCAWLLSAVGVFFRDLTNVLPPLTQLLLFLSPVFFPIEALPAALRGYLRINPLAHVMENIREIIIYNRWPSLEGIILQTLLSGCFALAALYVFKRLSPRFSDAL